MDTLWAEDGSVYLLEGLTHGAAALARPYNGFLQLTPRALGLLAASLPLQAAPTIMGVGAAAVVGALSAYVWVASSAYLHSLTLRFTAAALFPLVPSAILEAANNAVNLHWYLLAAAFWAVLDRPPGPARTIAAAMVAFVAGVNTPLSLLLVPLGIWRLRPDDSQREWVPLVALFLGLIAQGLVMVNTEQVFPDVFDGLGFLPLLFGLRVEASLLIGERWLPGVWAAVGWVAPAVLLAALVVGLIAARRWIERERFRPIALATLLSLAVFATGAGLRGPSRALVPVGAQFSTAASRYTVGPAILLGAGLLLLADGRPRGKVGAFFLIPVLAIGIAFASSYALPNSRTAGPSWREELARGRSACSDSEERTVRLLLAPHGIGSVRMPCFFLLT